MRHFTTLTLFCGVGFAATVLEGDGWRRQEQSGAIAYFKGDEAMVMVAPAKPFTGDLRAAFAKALQSYMGGNVVAGGEVREREGGAVMAEYEVQEPNGTRTYRAATAWARGGQMEALLYATNDAAAYQRNRATAMAFLRLTGSLACHLREWVRDPWLASGKRGGFRQFSAKIPIPARWRRRRATI